MRLRVWIIGILTACLLISAMPQAAAGVRLGTACPRPGMTAKVKQTPLVCVKVGKKNVWRIARPAPTATTATPSTPSVDPSWVSYSTTVDGSFRKIQQYLAEPPKGGAQLTVTIHQSESFPQDIADLYRQQVSRLTPFFGSLLEKSQHADIYLYTELDQVALSALSPSSAATGAEYAGYWRTGDRRGQCPGVAGWFLQLDGQTQSSLHGGILVNSVVNLTSIDAWCRHILLHEWTHAFQDYWVGGGLPNRGAGTRDDWDKAQLPIFREGSADMLTMGLASSSTDDYLSVMKSAYRGWANWLPPFKEVKTEADVVTLLERMERRSAFPEAHNMSYRVGQAFFEYLNVEFGFDKYLELLKTVRRDRDFEQVFESVYGLSLTDAYRRSAPAVLAMINVLKANS